MFKWCNAVRDEDDAVIDVFNKAYFGYMMKFMHIYISNDHDVANTFDDDRVVQYESDLQGVQESIKNYLFDSDEDAHAFISEVIEKKGKGLAAKRDVSRDDGFTDILQGDQGQAQQR